MGGQFFPLLMQTKVVRVSGIPSCLDVVSLTVPIDDQRGSRS